MDDPLTFAGVKAAFNQGKLSYRALFGGDSRRQLRREFIAWRMEMLGGICPVCEEPMVNPRAIVIDHQHPMDRDCEKRERVRERYRGYVRDIVHDGCNHSIRVVESGRVSAIVPHHRVYWYLIAYARVDEPRRLGPRPRRPATLAPNA